jgi:acetyltransferase-like isoleucine patch superfamily enzyme
MLLGKGVSLFTCSQIHWGNYLKLGHQVSLSAWSKNGIQWVNNINIGTNCWSGSKVTVLNGVAIGNGCIIAPEVLSQNHFQTTATLVGFLPKL